MNDGGITVTKTSTGSILLNDIQMVIHHQHATYIPADKALNSADLHRALNSRAIFQMLNTMTTAAAPAAAPDNTRATALEEENRLLREALKKSTQQGTALQSSVDALGSKLELLAAAVSKIPTTQMVVRDLPPGTPVSVPSVWTSEAVGGDVPMFIPDNIVPKNAEVQVHVQETSSDGDTVAAAQSQLRKLRRGQAG